MTKETREAFLALLEVAEFDTEDRTALVPEDALEDVAQTLGFFSLDAAVDEAMNGEGGGG